MYRDKEMSVNKFMQLWEYGYFVVQELGQRIHKKKSVGQLWTWTRMGNKVNR
jgi:hypothetical protein